MNKYNMDYLLDGIQLLEYNGNYYEYIGISRKTGKFLFQNVDDDSFVELTLNQLRKVIYGGNEK